MTHAYKRNSKVRRKIKQKIGERDGWTCHICGQPIDQTLPPGHEMQGSIDHLTPRRQGGTGDRDNVRMSHHRCNHERDAAERNR